MSTTTTFATPKPGSLTIAGSGIASVVHITLETLAHIQGANAVFYVVADPATKAFIRKNPKSPCTDLHVFSHKIEPRYDTYVQMAEVSLHGDFVRFCTDTTIQTMLNAMIMGRNALGVFYGHPGVFVSPSRKALAIAREEGYQAKMLPSSTLQCTVAARFEATHLLLRNTPPYTSINIILWHVGAVSVSKMDFEARLLS